MTMTATLPDYIENLDIVNAGELAFRILNEFVDCASATRDETSPADLNRIKAAIARFTSRFETDAATPELDLPKYHPHQTKFGVWPVTKNKLPIQNSDINGIVNILQALVVEMSHSDSAERSSGYSVHDANRVRAVIDKVNQKIGDMDGDNEIDLPDASDQPTAGKGK